jgi:hypothetical protein
MDGIMCLCVCVNEIPMLILMDVINGWHQWTALMDLCVCVSEIPMLILMDVINGWH